MELLVATYNVHGLRRPLSVARVIRALDADVVLVQEFLSKTVLRAVARRAGMRSVGRAPRSRPFQRNAVLVPRGRRVLRQWPVELPSVPPRASRGAQIAILQVQGHAVLVASVHLGLRPSERVDHASLLAEHLERGRGPFVLGGDLNEGPEGPAARLLGERLGPPHDTVPTFPTEEPIAKIDFVFAGRGASVARERVHDDAIARRASDHLPVAAVIDIER